jgi:hypothetical protein
MKEAARSHHALACHARALYNHLGKLARGRPYVTIHENAVNMLRPVVTVPKGFGEVAQVSYEAKEYELAAGLAGASLYVEPSNAEPNTETKSRQRDFSTL